MKEFISDLHTYKVTSPYYYSVSRYIETMLVESLHFHEDGWTSNFKYWAAYTLCYLPKKTVDVVPDSD